MKTISDIFVVLLLLFFLGSCVNSKKNTTEKDNQNSDTEELQPPNPSNDRAFVRCSTMEVLEKHMAKTPDLRSKMETIERHCQRMVKTYQERSMEEVSDTILIPTIVHVIYSNEIENISNEQIDSQISVLNQDFTKTNEDNAQTPEEFVPLASNTNIQFSLDSIVRVSSTRSEWGTDDQMKFSSSGGSDVITPDTHLNIWVCTIGGGILGYAQFPGDNTATDGIVVSTRSFGTFGSAVAPFDKGRTTTHEVGHWLNLRHIWGDGNCSIDDFVDDTPVSDAPNYGCPSYPSVSCNTNDITMNFMDYTDDVCMYMFTQGQKERMRSVFAEGGPRENFIKK